MQNSSQARLVIHIDHDHVTCMMLQERAVSEPLLTAATSIEHEGQRLAMVHGPATGLALLKELDGDARLAGHYRLDAVRAYFCEMAGDYEAALAHYRAAASLITSIPERNYLITRAARLV